MRAALEHLAERAGDSRKIGDPRSDGGAGAELRGLPPRDRRARATLEIEVVGVGEAAHAYEPVAWAEDAADVVDVARSLINPGDAVLVKASRAVGLEGIAEEITNFARAWSPS